MGNKLIAIEAKEPYLAVTWQVNNFCNYKCSYCNPGNYKGSDRNDKNLYEYINNLNTIIDKYLEKDYKHFKFFFSGGEPTAWKNLIPICEFLRNRLPDCTLAVNTNLSRPIAWWEKHYKLFDDVVASFHVEFADKQKYQDVNLFLCDKINYLCTKLLMHEERFWEIVEYGQHLKSVMPNYFIEWTPLFDEMTINAGPWKYKDSKKTEFLMTHNIEQQFTIPKPYKNSSAISFSKFSDGSFVHTNSNEVIINRQNYFKNWTCNVGDAIFINPIGMVSLASCGQGENIGHILEDIKGVGPKQIICKKDYCHCGTDIIIPKKKF